MAIAEFTPAEFPFPTKTISHTERILFALVIVVISTRHTITSDFIKKLWIQQLMPRDDDYHFK